MPVDYNTMVLILGSIVGLVGGAIGLKLVSKWGESVSSKSFKSRLDYLVDENNELKKYLKSVKGSIAQMKQGLQLPDNTNLEEIDENGSDSLIKGLIAKYSMMAPPQLRPILQDPAIVGFLLEEAKKHPEQTKEVLKHFIGSSGSVSKLSDGGTDKQQFEDYQTTGA